MLSGFELYPRWVPLSNNKSYNTWRLQLRTRWYESWRLWLLSMGLWDFARFLFSDPVWILWFCVQFCLSGLGYVILFWVCDSVLVLWFCFEFWHCFGFCVFVVVPIGPYKSARHINTIFIRPNRNNCPASEFRSFIFRTLFTRFLSRSSVGNFIY